jgi:hypothetical protein
MRTGNFAAVMRTMGHRDVKTAMHYQHPELVLCIDGQIGSETSQALHEFAKKHSHPSTVTNPFLQANFLDVLNPKL